MQGEASSWKRRKPPNEMLHFLSKARGNLILPRPADAIQLGSDTSWFTKIMDHHARACSHPLRFSVCALAGAVQHGGMPLTVADYPLYPASAVNGNKQWSGSVNLRVESFHNAFGRLVLLIDSRVPAGGRFGAIKKRNQCICACI